MTKCLNPSVSAFRPPPLLTATKQAQETACKLLVVEYNCVTKEETFYP